MKQDGYDQKGAPVYDWPVAIVDFWSLLMTGQIAGRETAFGVACPDDLQRLMRVPPDIETDMYAPDVPWRTEYGALAFAFDSDRLLWGVYFGGDSGERIPPGVEEAAAGLNIFSDARKAGDIFIGRSDAVIRLWGLPGTRFATLPNFIGLIPADTAVNCSAMPMRKSISMSVRSASRQLKAEFILKAFKFDYAEPFHIDYCLHTLSVVDQSYIPAG